ncbi:MAG: sialate O-acetylesterase [Bacteroidales bacterium]|nr:sialate O-acetylesterase [Bacteroidales bacterium]
MESAESLREHLVNYSSSIAYKNPTTVYNAMLHPLSNYTIKREVWYQGESNVFRASEYMSILSALVKNWRTTFSNNCLDFFIVELPLYNYAAVQCEPGKLNSAEILRKAQTSLAMKDEHCHLISTSGLVNPENIPPTNKRALGERIVIYRLR